MRHHELTGQHGKVFEVNGRRVSGVAWLDLLEGAGVDLRDALALVEMGATDLQVWRALARACERVGLEFHVSTGLPDGGRRHLV